MAAHKDYPDKDAVASEEDGQNIAELDDWEEAANIFTPKLKTSENAQLVYGAKKHEDFGNEGADKQKYSRDFLLTFVEQCIELPLDFEIGHDIAPTNHNAEPMGTFIQDLAQQIAKDSIFNQMAEQLHKSVQGVGQDGTPQLDSQQYICNM